MTQPTHARWLTILAGWLFAPRRTVTGILIAAGVSGNRHHAGFHRFFSSARWSKDELGLAILRLVLLLLPKDRPVFIAIDDTLARKRGRKIFGVGMHHDPLLSSTKKAVLNRGHSWVVLAVVIELPSLSVTFSLPFLFRLYRNRKSCKPASYRKKPELAVALLTKLAEAFPARRFHVLADSAYSGQTVVKKLPEGFEFTGRLPLNAQLFAPPPPHVPGKRGRARKRGDRLPSPKERLAAGGGKWITHEIYGRRDRTRVITQDALWYAALGTRLVRTIAVEPKNAKSGRKSKAFYSTDLSVKPIELLRRYSLRWSIEVAFHDAKQSLGFEDPQGWTRKAVWRAGPMAMLLYSLVVIWFAKRKHKDRVALPARPWYNLRRGASFADMLATLKRETVHRTIFSQRRSHRHSPKLLENLVIHCAGAA